MYLRRKETIHITVGDSFILFNKDVPCGLGVQLNVHLTIEEHTTRRINLARAAKA